ncbi:MAG TPA: 6,7-dimethyl-8-ribityllumazine synthase [Bryobacteraceae bacterium]|jgi:6,7-dimethyl-8-ribityllumazine synthase|nr:6,7-dimethyl-8-ribityllumazine synthase [Bryobacteraceae bacterium]
MSNQPIEWAHDGRGLRFAIVVSRFNHRVTDKLLASAREALEKAGAERAAIFYVPGAFELPLAAKLLARTHAYHGIVALGAVIRGETPHFDYVAAEAARGLQQVMLETGVPVSFGVLTTENLEQAEARVMKGADAAMTAIEMVRFSASVAQTARS